MKNVRSVFRRTVYGTVFLMLLLFLMLQGMAPWRSVMSHPMAFVAVVLVTSASLLMQSLTYWHCLAKPVPSIAFPELVRMWSLSGLVGLVAPLFAGLAVRTTLMKSWGVSVRDSTLASVRQILLGVESSLLCAGLVLVIYPPEYLPWVGFAFLLVAGIWWGARRWLGRRPGFLPPHAGALVAPLLAPPRAMLLIFSMALPGLMAINYLIAFHEFGTSMSFHEAVLLAALTVLISATAIIPNGLGILDALWITVARQKGMEAADSIGMVLTLRLGYICSASILWMAISLRRKCHPN